MDSGILLLGLLGLAALVGGLVSFFSIFSKGDQKTKLWQLEQELKQLKLRLESYENSLKNAPLANKTTLATAPLNAAPALQQTIPIAQNVTPSEQKSPATVEMEISPEVEFVASDVRITSATITPKLAEPNFIERGIAYAKNWLFGGNTLVRSGIVILFIGISFLIKYATDHTHVPIELRLMGITLGGIALLVLGWRLRNKRPQYSWALQGGGIGVLYLTIFAALKLYSLIPSAPAFALLAAVAFLSAFIAVKQSALPLAILGFAGGFLAPVLTSTGQGSHVGLFSYYLVLNLGIAYVAFHKSWRPLNVLGWAFTFIIGTLWGAKNYVPEHFASTEPFLVIFFLLFTGIAVLYAHAQATKSSDYVDATLVFGTPIVAFSLQYALLKDSQFGLAYSALTLGIFYLSLAWWVLTRQRDTLKFLGECFLALGIGFATLALPLALDGRWTSAAWAVEGVGLLWVGLKQNRTFPALAGLALQLLGAGAFVFGWGLSGYTETSSQNMFLGAAFIALSGWACGALCNTYRPIKLGALTTLLALWGWVWWVASGLNAIDQFLPNHLFVIIGLAFVAITSALLPIVARYFKWQKLATLSTLLLPAMFITLLANLFDNAHPFAHYGYIVWPLAFVVYAWLITSNGVPNRSWLRAPLLWLIAIVGVFEWQHLFNFNMADRSLVWMDIGWAIVPMLLIGAVTRWQNANHQVDSKHTWLWLACLPLAVFLVCWFAIMSLNSNGSAAPLPYIPLLNPLDIALAAVILLLLVWQRAVGSAFNKLNAITPKLVGVMSFTLLNGMLLRTLHHWVGTPFEWVSLLSNSTVQMAFTILWGLTAFALMLFAHKRGRRQIWIIGASLMALVVAKLFLLDLAQHGSVERIVSFIGAGLMLLVMGYFAPLPPANLHENKEAL